MSIRATDLVTAYGHSLEQQIVGRGSNLVCRDEELWKQVEALLRDGDAQEIHWPSLEPLRVMEESLKSSAAAVAAAAAASAGRMKTRGGLQGLAKAFEVVEQAALNLYLCPWREEYKVIKMYSGMFTHHIKPVLSMPQIEKLFGLLGYQLSLSRHEQLCLQSPRVSPATPDDLLRLSCAFFLARCECRLLLTALGKHGGDAQWELSLVRERQKGHSVQVALDNTKKMFEDDYPLMKVLDEEVVDLYTDEEVNKGQRGMVVNDDENSRCLTWAAESSAPPAIKSHSNGVTFLSSSSASLSSREDIHINTLNCQLTKTSPPESDTTRSSSVNMKQGKRPCEESVFDNMDSLSSRRQVDAMGLYKTEPEINHFCSCLKSSSSCLKVCVECNTLHCITCALLQHCNEQNHRSEFYDDITQEMKESRAVSPHSGSLRVTGMSESPVLTSSSAAMSSLALCDEPPLSSLPLFTYHDCCDLTDLDPQVLCYTCRNFHSDSCRLKDTCQNRHKIKKLGVCSCGMPRSRDPLILCRYCGNEYCRDCWYKNPLECTCGQNFDQSSSV